MMKISDLELEAARRRYRSGESITTEEEEAVRAATSSQQWRDMQHDRHRALTPHIVPGKSDIEKAQEYRAKALDLLDKATVLLNAARADGMTISWQFGPPDQFNRQQVVFLEVTKKLA